MKRFNMVLAILIVAVACVMALPALSVQAAPSHATGTIFADAKGDACAGIGLAGGSCSGSGSATTANNFVATLINIFSVVVGVIAVIMIILAGAKFISSGGDTSKIASAKTSIIYAIVGLVIVVGAQAIVRFVLNNAKV
jgi:hypothetical protein